MMRKRVEHLLNKTSAQFILGFTVVVIIVLTLVFLAGEYVGEEEGISTPFCPPGELC